MEKTLIKNRRLSKKLSKFIIVTFIFFQFFYYLPPQPTNAIVSTNTQTSLSDYSAGTTDSTLDLNQDPGNIRLKYGPTHESTHSATADFNSGHTFPELGASEVSSDKVILGEVYVYSRDSDPALEGNGTQKLHFDEVNNLLYSSDWGYGLNIFDTLGNDDPTDDQKITSYNIRSSPSAVGDSIIDWYIDQNNNLIYIASWGAGVTVINTQGTKTASDDVLIGSYTVNSSPALPTNEVYSIAIDESNNVLYIATSTGLLAIDTKGTVSISDDTTLITYTSSSTPAINRSSVNGVVFDSENNLLYVNTLDGVNVINTQGTKSPTDDTLVFTYTKSSTPNFIDNYVRDVVIDSLNDLLYLATDKGVSVINRQGTTTASDDTIVFNYTTTSTPPLAHNQTSDININYSNNYIYVATNNGLTVIDTKGTITATDDTLVSNYNTSSDPKNVDNRINDSYFDYTNNLLYIGNFYKGLSVINLANTYNNRSAFEGSEIFVEDDAWETKDNLNIARTAPASNVINGKIYVAAGTQDWTDQNTLEEYDPSSNIWTTKASMSEARNIPGSAVYNGIMYTFGGRDENWDASATVEAYNPSSNTWTTKTSIPVARVGPTAVTYNDKIYVIGGTTTQGWGNGTRYVDVYDPASNTWSSKSPAPYEIGSHTAEIINGKIYIAGSKTNYTPLGYMLEYDPSTDTWEKKQNMPEFVQGGTSTVLNGKFLYIGGSDSYKTPVKTIYIYDPVSDYWGKYIDLPVALHRPVAEIVDGELYVAAGKTSSSSNATYKLSTSTLSDLTQQEAYTELSWDATTPANTSVELLYSLDGGKNYTSMGTVEGSYKLPPNLAYSFKYKAVLSTTDTGITPSLDSVTVKYASPSAGLYSASSGSHTSSVIDAGRIVEWQDLVPTQTLPSGTSVAYYTRSGNTAAPDGTWSSWALVNSPISSPDGRYLQWRADLSTSDANQTPVISAVAVNYSTSSYASILSPSGYTNQNKPTVHFRKSTDTASSITSYKVQLDAHKNRSFSLSGIPPQGNGSAQYTWKDDSTARVVFYKENDSDTSNDEISVYFKSLDTVSLSEGKHIYTVTDYGTGGSSAAINQEFIIDNTPPSLGSLTLQGKNLNSSGQVFTLSNTDRLPLFAATVTDPYKGSQITNSNGTKDTFEPVASGPQSVTLTLYKLNEGGSKDNPSDYVQFLSQDLALSNYQDTQGIQKTTDFSGNTSHSLSDGYYKAVLTLKDQAGNSTEATPFYLSYNYKSTTAIGGAGELAQASPTPKPLKTTLVQEEEPEAEKPSINQIEEADQDGYTAEVSVIDEQGDPVPGAKVILNPGNHIAYTNVLGVATFSGLPPATYKAAISFDNYQGEQELILAGAATTQQFKIQVEPKQNQFPYILAGTGGLFLIALFVILLKRKK